ncbi:multidrug effflux MFS transporter [Bradyrhizobium sp. RT3a]|uniref:multidrug effflux MFS transporter n=1 Tax=unclassified Bradyrhizobium TaxID=2631580 RepID=UPI003392633F
MRIQPASFAFTLLLGLLASVPYSGIDMSLPALAATGAALGAPPADVGFTMSVFMLSLATAPLVYGPVSDRYGRRPVVVFGVTLFVVGSLACALAQSLPVLLVCRFGQGCGAASTTLTFAIIRDLFEGDNARAKMANVVIAINVVTLIAPTAGAALLALGSWRLIYTIQFVMGLVLLIALVTGFAESAKIDQTNRLAPSIIGRSYLQVLRHPISFAYILVGAAAGGTVMAYVTGSSLFFINSMGLRPNQYGLIFSACSGSVMAGAFFDRRLVAWNVSPAYVLMRGLTVSAVASGLLLATTLVGWVPLLLVVSLLVAVGLAFGLTIPNAIRATMHPLPQIAGAVGAVSGSIQMMAGAVSSGLVACLYDGRSALSMAAVMTPCSLLALASYLLIARPAERRVFAS